MGYVGKACFMNPVHVLMNAIHLAKIALFGPDAARNPLSCQKCSTWNILLPATMFSR